MPRIYGSDVVAVSPTLPESFAGGMLSAGSGDSVRSGGQPGLFPQALSAAWKVGDWVLIVEG